MQTTSRVRQSIELPESAKEDYLIITTGKTQPANLWHPIKAGDPPAIWKTQLKVVFTGKESLDVYDKNTDTSLASYKYTEGKVYKVLGIAFSQG